MPEREVPRPLGGDPFCVEAGRGGERISLQSDVESRGTYAGREREAGEEAAVAAGEAAGRADEGLF